jgi:1-deoxy-D-xylulose-5-phosphate reductoisomerase
LDIAYQSIAKGGNTPCVMNAANEIAVHSFLQDKISFLQISDVIENTIAKTSFICKPTLNDYFQTDKESRIIASQFINQLI